MRCVGIAIRPYRAPLSARRAHWPASRPKLTMDSSITVNESKIELAPIVSLSRKAGEAILKIYKNPTEDWNVQTKTDDSPLTQADLAANAEICATLEELYPDIPIMSEETKAAPYEERSKWTHYWCVDPLDGTKEFVKRNGEFTVNIALMKSLEHGAQPILGVVHAPVLGVTYYAAEGVGAYKKDADGEEKIAVKDFSEDDEGLILVCSRSHLDERTQKFLDKFKNATTKSMGSSLKFMLVASGEAHIYPRMAPTMEWDTAASQIVVEEAGGIVLDADTMKPLRYNKENLRNPYFFVYGKRTSEPDE